MGLQDADELTGRGGSGVDEADGGSGYSLQDGQQERVMRTPEHDRICAGAQERLEAFPDGRLGQRAIELQALDEFHEPPAYPLDHLYVSRVGVAGIQVLRSL